MNTICEHTRNKCATDNCHHDLWEVFSLRQSADLRPGPSVSQPVFTHSICACDFFFFFINNVVSKCGIYNVRILKDTERSVGKISNFVLPKHERIKMPVRNLDKFQDPKIFQVFSEY